MRMPNPIPARTANVSSCATPGSSGEAQGHTRTKKQKWAHILPKKLTTISKKIQLGWDVAYVDGSKNEEGQMMSETKSYPSLCMKNRQSPEPNSQRRFMR